LEAALQSEPVFNVQSMIFREQTNFLFGKWCLFIVGTCLAVHVSYTNKYGYFRILFIYFHKHYSTHLVLYLG
jgi:hypothetical protein